MSQTKIEYADGDRGNGSYPSHWGVPPAGQFSQARAAWVLRNIHNASTRSGTALGSSGLSGDAAMRKVQELIAKHPLERSARLALRRAQSLERDSAAALRYANHLALRAGLPID